MFQDIDPHTLTYDPDHGAPGENDHLMFLRDGRVLLAADGGRLAVPTYGEVRAALRDKADDAVYLFSMDETAFYYSPEEINETNPYTYNGIRVVRSLAPALLSFACATAFHFAQWYRTNRYCGQCGCAMLPRERERALQCPCCSLVKYPRISPAIIVAVADGEELLLTKYSGREYTNFALVAGFVEPGETLEAAIAREVKEEVGLEIANVRYYKSQPWAFSQSILMGFFADLHGERTITIDPGELSEAGWYPRSALPADESRFSLTWDMIEAFRNNEV
ncbi:NUDIX hydrolase [Desulfovibrio sp. X2]|uniref:NAD(+) diphosphatase n=1 Tax=Desulfovibrio sp. X2 TaxID=941449 RepID=UPI000358751D|nr:NAD(+) diphosphatase [Desulfovibrio sp. X2]EPR44052.1 NUDIX hydrolase [Desulfovibrio sp. X2]